MICAFALGACFLPLSSTGPLQAQPPRQRALTSLRSAKASTRWPCAPFQRGVMKGGMRGKPGTICIQGDSKQPVRVLQWLPCRSPSPRSCSCSRFRPSPWSRSPWRSCSCAGHPRAAATFPAASASTPHSDLRVSQPDRARGFEPRCCRFKSCREGHPEPF